MADHKRYPFIFLLFMASFIFCSYAYQFNVGGRDGWIVKPSEDYNHWSGRMRFQVNDTLFFKYKKGSNSVLVVNKDDYYKCNVDKPITRLEDGNSIFKFDRSGPFYFISGNKTNCDQGQKIITVVLAVRTPPKPPAPGGVPPTSSPAPALSPISPPSTAPTPAGTASTPAPAVSPISPPSTAPTPAGTAPTPAPALSPMSPPSTAPTPAGTAPTPAPALSPMSPPSTAPTPSGTAPSPGLSPPSSPPTSSPPSSSAPGSPPGPAGGSSPAGPPGGNSPPGPGSSARPAFTSPSTVMVSTVSLLVASIMSL